MIRKYIIPVFVIILVIHILYLFFKVGHEITESTEEPSILYGRQMEVRNGDDTGNLRLTERLTRLSYRKVSGTPHTAGTFSEDETQIQIFPRDTQINNQNEQGPVKIAIQDGRVASLISSDGKLLESIRLEPEEIDRIMNPKTKSRHPVLLSAISPYLQDAVIATEDARFYHHIGIDPLAMGRALFINLKERRFAQGASTITQQLVKNSFLSPKKTLWRKLQEMELAVVIESRYSKKQILQLYLNRIYFGQDGLRAVYGIEEAADFYFSKQAKNLSLDESALLAGIIRSPNRYAILRNVKMAKARRNKVLARMRSLEMIREDEFKKASNMPVRLQPHSVPVHMASFFTDYVQRMTTEELGSESIFPAGCRYYTTLDPIHQAYAQEAVTQGLAEVEKTAPSENEPLQAALVAVDPRTGAVTAMVGGRDCGKTQFNRALDARRQPGSAFKPFVLLTALSLSTQGKGDKTLSTSISGGPVSIPTPEGTWSPSNFEQKTYGMIPLRKMIEDSVNTATVRLARDVGLEEVLKTARTSGITSPLLPVPSMSLGTFEVTPMELAYAYATLASGGIRFEPYPLQSVTTANGDILIRKKVHEQRAFDPRPVYLTSYALEGVLERGTAKSAKALGIYFPASGKTGTTDNYRDSWFVGYTRDVVCAVWVGYDRGADTGLTGADGAFHIWAKFLHALYPQSGPQGLVPPEGIETAVIDPESGYLATDACPHKLKEAYLTGTAPKEICRIHRTVPVVDKIRKGARGIWDFFRNLFH